MEKLKKHLKDNLEIYVVGSFVAFATVVAGCGVVAVINDRTYKLNAMARHNEGSKAYITLMEGLLEKVQNSTPAVNA